tara:strand:- start:280 stop:1035 length:756 start_codon:yes stop_codon:yes gene_type:complete
MGLTEASAFKDNTIVNSDIKSDAAIAQSKVNLSISNAEVASNAAIDLSKLATATLPNGITISASNISDLTTFLNSILPSQSGNSGKYLKTNGTNTSWGTIPTNTPAFRAELQSTQTISNDTFTVVEFDNDSTEHNFDTDNCYSTSTFRFTPNVAGYYFVNAQTTLSSATRPNVEDAEMKIQKNGSTVAKSEIDPADDKEMGALTCNATVLVQMNGSSDYLDVTASIERQTSNAEIQAGNHQTFFQAFKLNI